MVFDNGGRIATVLTSVIAACKRPRLDPFANLRDLFGRIAAHLQARIAEPLPNQWKTARLPTPTSNLPSRPAPSTSVAGLRDGYQRTARTDNCRVLYLSPIKP